MKRIARSTLQTAANLIFFAIIATAVLSSTYFLTRDAIQASVEAEKMKLINQLVPPAMYDNDIIKDTLAVPADELLGTEDTTLAYRARLKGEPTAVVLESVAPDGYAGKIWMILAVNPSGELAGVRVVSHNETPGLGDYIDIQKSSWIKDFDGKSRKEYSDADWKVKKDGGKFDYMAGATITPRAVVKAVNKALKYFEQNREKLFAPAAPAKEEAK